MLPLQFEQRSMSTQTEDIDITQFLFGAKVHKVRILESLVFSFFSKLKAPIEFLAYSKSLNKQFKS